MTPTAPVRTDPRIIQVDCSWCQTVMTAGTAPVSHGICPACIAKFTDADPLQAWIEPIDIRD